MKLFLSIIICYHISFIITESTFPLFSWLRNLDNWIGKLFSCILCVSIWVGWIVALNLYNYAEQIGFEDFTWFISGIFYSFWTWFIYQLMIRLEE